MKYVLVIAAMLAPFLSRAQRDTVKWVVTPPAKHAFVHTNENMIRHADKLNPAFERLQLLRAGKKSTIRIVHIGDSHIQADMLTEVMRTGFQEYFGNAGRGTVFPYQLGKSNAPSDVASTSNVTWMYNRCAHPEIDIPNGATGFGIHSKNPEAYVCLRLKNDTNDAPKVFNKLSFFLGKDSACYTLTAPNLLKPITKCTRKDVDTPSLVFTTDSLLTEFSLSRASAHGEAPNGTYSFYGVMLERTDLSGVIYNTIGCNGVQFSQLINNDLFCEQLHGIKGDLYIVSLGTNEAQNAGIKTDSFLKYVDSFVHLVHSIAPKAPIIVTTPPGSYFKQKKPNATLEKVTQALITYCNKHEIPFWDLYHITGGYKGAASWKKSGLMSHDLVHYNMDGYQLQGELLLNAVALAYNNFNKAHPYKPAFVPKQTGKPKEGDKKVIKTGGK